MSDGPHRTLPLRQQWRELLKRAYKPAYERQDVADAMCPALERDSAWELSREFVTELRAFCHSEEPTLFGDEIERMKRMTAGRGTLGQTIAEFVAGALAQGMKGEAALLHAFEQGLNDRLVRNVRSMEEHVLRECGDRQASQARTKLDSAISGAAVNALAQKLTNQAASAKAAPPKHGGVDDGVGLR